MYCKQTFAIIVDEVVVRDMVCSSYTTANDLAHMTYGDTAFAVESTQYPVSEGDIYRDGVFYFKDGATPIPRQNTAEEDAREALATAQQAAADASFVAVMQDIIL